jgi:hypothetical protein
MIRINVSCRELVMEKLVFSQQQIEAESDYAQLHEACGLKLHGGFASDGEYISPRTRYRWLAIDAWHEQLKSRGVEIVEATTELLTEPNFPNEAQQILLLKNGFEVGFWDSLTITGLIEGRGRALADVVAPNFQQIIVEDISATALGHMNKGLLRAHGWDEGGDGSEVGGHDVMWFAARDLVFGSGAHPIPVPPASIGRDRTEREMELIPAEHERLISFLMNLLMIEVRAERAFSFYERVLRCEEVFVDRRANALLAAKLVDRIRQDEAVHVAWLRAAISEFRSFTIKTVPGGRVSGAEILDPVWQRMIHWHAVEMHEAKRDSSREEMKRLIMKSVDGEVLYEEFAALAS